ncbi:MAG: patatin-like phospholipase family protein [Gemmatimonadota bacterium]
MPPTEPGAVTTERVVVVMGGGGAKAAAHAGAHRALEELGIVPVHYIGTSMGAVLGALFASGLDAPAVLSRMMGIGEKEAVAPDPLAIVKGLWLKSVLKPGPLRATLGRLVTARRFSELRIPLTVTATALDNGELVLFGAGGRDAPLLDVLYATCALPVFYPAGVIEGRHYADGGLRSVLPVTLAAALDADLVVAIDVGPGFDEAPASAASALPPIVQAHSDSSGILMASNTALELALWHLTPGRPPLVHVRPRVERGSTFRVDQVRRYAEEGYTATKQSLAALIPGAG